MPSASMLRFKQGGQKTIPLRGVLSVVDTSALQGVVLGTCRCRGSYKVGGRAGEEEAAVERRFSQWPNMFIRGADSPQGIPGAEGQRSWGTLCLEDAIRNGNTIGRRVIPFRRAFRDSLGPRAVEYEPRRDDKQTKCYLTRGTHSAMIWARLVFCCPHVT